MLEERWASPEDFATLFQYFWYRDFPMDDNKAIGARRVDWTIHIGIIVRNIADLMGFVTRFEAGGRKDAVLRSVDGDEIAIEWEWEDLLDEDSKLKGNELGKLRCRQVWPTGKILKCAVLVTYTQASEEKTKKIYDELATFWKGAPWPLLLILIDFGKFEKLHSRRGFQQIRMSKFYEGKHEELRKAKAFPWEVMGTTWSYRLKSTT